MIRTLCDNCGHHWMSDTKEYCADCGESCISKWIRVDDEERRLQEYIEWWLDAFKHYEFSYEAEESLRKLINISEVSNAKNN